MPRIELDNNGDSVLCGSRQRGLVRACSRPGRLSGRSHVGLETDNPVTAQEWADAHEARIQKLIVDMERNAPKKFVAPPSGPRTPKPRPAPVADVLVKLLANGRVATAQELANECGLTPKKVTVAMRRNGKFERLEGKVLRRGRSWAYRWRLANKPSETVIASGIAS